MCVRHLLPNIRVFFTHCCLHTACIPLLACCLHTAACIFVFRSKALNQAPFCACIIGWDTTLARETTLGMRILHSVVHVASCTNKVLRQIGRMMDPSVPLWASCSRSFGFCSIGQLGPMTAIISSTCYCNGVYATLVVRFHSSPTLW